MLASRVGAACKPEALEHADSARAQPLAGATDPEIGSVSTITDLPVHGGLMFAGASGA